MGSAKFTMSLLSRFCIRKSSTGQRQVHKEGTMSPEMIAIIAVGIAIMGIHMTTFIYLLRRMDGIQKEISEVKERVARLEGILIGQQQMAANGAPGQFGDD